MGHYGDCYEAEAERVAKLKREEREKKAAEQAKRTAKLKAQYPNDPSKWEISTDERLKLLEQRLNKLENKCR